MSRVSKLALALATTLVAAPAVAQTNGYLLPCAATGSIGRGCTLLGAPGDPAAMLSHPASLAGRTTRALSLSGAAFLPTMTYTNRANLNGVDGKDNVFPIPAFYVADRSRGPITLGLGAQVLGGMGADYQLTHALLGADQRYHSKFGLMKGGLAAAWQVTPVLSIGGSIGALYGQLEMATPYSLNPTAFAGMAGLAQIPEYSTLFANFPEATAYVDITGFSGFAASGALSAEYRVNPRLTLAAAWTPPATTTLSSGHAAMDMTAQFTQLYNALVMANGGGTGATAIVAGQLSSFGIDMSAGMQATFDAEAKFGIPQTAVLALGWQPNDRLHVGIDAGWIGYKSAFKDMPLTMTAGSNANINILMNADPANGSFANAWQLQWKDSWVLRAGAELAATNRLALRAGMLYGTNPVPANTLFTIFPAVVQTSATVGFGYRMGSVTAQAAWAHTFGNDVLAASSHLVALEYSGSRSRLTENLFSFGLDWNY